MKKNKYSKTRLRETKKVGKARKELSHRRSALENLSKNKADHEKRTNRTMIIIIMAVCGAMGTAQKEPRLLSV